MDRYSIKLISTLIIVITGILNIFIFFIFTYRATESSIEERYLREADLLLSYTKKIFDSRFDSAEKVLRQIGADHELIQAAKDENLELLTKKLTIFDEMIPGNQSIWLGLRTGAYASSTDVTMPQVYDPRETKWYTQSVDSRSEHWSEPFLDYLDQEIVFALSRTLEDETGESIGVSTVLFEVESLGTDIDTAQVGTNGYIMLLSNTGEVIANREDFFIGRHIFGLEFLHLSEGDSRDIIIDGESYNVNSKPLSVNGMILATAVNRHDIRTELNAVFTRISIIEALVLILTSFTIYLLTRRGIAPLSQLVALMQSVECGDYSVRAEFTQYKEMSVLSHGFNSMIRGLNTRDEILKNREVEIKHLAYYDSLTGLPNRVLLLQTLNEQLHSDDANENTGAIMYIDLDRFKIINDTMGHSVGDKVLVEVGRKISHHLRHGQMAARLGGDEFVVLLPGIESVDLIMKVADRLLDVLNIPVRIDSRSYDTHASMGIVFYPLHGGEVDVLLKKADMAMYKAKRSGKNNYQIFEENLESEILKKLKIKNGIRDALKHDQFTVYFQPQYRVVDRTVSGMEALLRTNSPDLAEIPIEELISVAEETGQVAEIETFVLTESCRFGRDLLDIGLHDIKISINMSPVHITQQELVPKIISIIEDSGVSKEMIELEITESILIDFHESNMRKLNAFNEHGIRIHMDDFGTGYSSLNYLQELPIHYVKIDKSFVQKIDGDGTRNRIPALIIELAHSLDLQVIAEGVETESQFDYLRRNNCDIIQGFLLSRPLPPQHVLRLLTQKDAEVVQ